MIKTHTQPSLVVHPATGNPICDTCNKPGAELTFYLMEYVVPQLLVANIHINCLTTIIDEVTGHGLTARITIRNEP